MVTGTANALATATPTALAVPGQTDNVTATTGDASGE